MRFKLQNLAREYKQFIMLFFDLIALLFALYLAFVLRLGSIWPSNYIYESWWLFLVIPIVIISLFVKLGLYRTVLQYIGFKIFTTTLKSITISCLIVGFFMMFFMFGPVGISKRVPRACPSFFRWH